MILKKQHLKGNFAMFGIRELGKCTKTELKKVFEVAPTLFDVEKMKVKADIAAKLKADIAAKLKETNAKA